MPAITPKQATRRLGDEIRYHLCVLEKVERGLADLEAGRTVSHAEARERLSRWLNF